MGNLFVVLKRKERFHETVPVVDEYGIGCPFCEDIREVVFGLNVVDDYSLGRVFISDRVVLDVHEPRGLERQFSSFGDGNGGLIVTVDEGPPFVDPKLFLNGGEPENMVGGLEHGDVFRFHGGTRNNALLLGPPGNE